jgi:polyisoprenoid-binding protein YceI
MQADPIKAPEDKTTRGSRTAHVVLTALAMLVLLAGAGIYWFLSGRAPDAVDLEETAGAITTSSASEEAMSTSVPSTTAISAMPSAEIDGRWQVDTSVGTFDITGQSTATFAGFRVEEVLSSIGSTTAVGRTPVLSGSIDINGTTLTTAEIVADLTSIESDQSRRENAIQRALGTDANPTAIFVLTEPIDLGETGATGETVEATARGELTINGITRQVEIPIQAALVDGRVLVTGSSDLSFAAFEVSAPRAPIVVSVEDQGILEFQVWFSR